MDDHDAHDYTPLPQTNAAIFSSPPARQRRPLTLLSVATCAVVLLVVAAVASTSGRAAEVLDYVGIPATTLPETATTPADITVSRGVKEGVSEKTTSSQLLLGAGATDYPWSNAMLAWQRTGYHFQPEKNWMNDPNGPLYYKGWYHLFYQWNPDSAVWGNITWGHAVSKNLINWYYLPLAMVPDHWYDINGVWTGSATMLPDGKIIMLYTGSTNASVQVQNLAVPADLDDPLLLRWVKSDRNPVLTPPPGIGIKDFRDPTTAWYDEKTGMWRITIGSKNAAHEGLALVYQTSDFVSYELLRGYMHIVPGTGMWECVDFYPVATTGGDVGLETSVSGPGVKHVLKASLDDDKHDYYAIGTYDAEADAWTPDDPVNDVGIGLRYDNGKFYASKTFYDPVGKRRLLWGWIGETDSEKTDLLKGWASVQAIPRTVLYDTLTGSNVLQWPVKEVDSLRSSSYKSFEGLTLKPGSVVPLEVGAATQLDIEAEFEVDRDAIEDILEADVVYNCSTSGGAYGRGVLGPFGLLVLADAGLSEQTAVYFYIAKGADGALSTFFCQDELRSSLANDIVKRVYGSIVPVLTGETLIVRILVDHSIVESFAQGGRRCITSRIYPTEAIYGAAKVFVFNNATDARVTAKKLNVWEMNSAFIGPFPSGM